MLIDIERPLQWRRILHAYAKVVFFGRKTVKQERVIAHIDVEITPLSSR